MLNHIDIDQKEGHGSVVGYVVDSDKEQFRYWMWDYTPHAKLISEWAAKNTSRIALLKNLNVDEGQRGKGYGNELLSDFIDEAMGDGAQFIALIADKGESQEDGFVLSAWYERNDFAKIVDTDAGPLMVTPSEIANSIRSLISSSLE